MIGQCRCSHCSRLLRCPCTGCLAALLPSASHRASGVSVARARVPLDVVQLRSCPLASEPRINTTAPTICWNLGQASTEASSDAEVSGLALVLEHALSILGSEQPWGQKANVGHYILKGGKIPPQDPWAFVVIDVPFCSHEECAGFITQNKKTSGIIIFPGIKHHSSGIQVSSPKVRVKRFIARLLHQMLFLSFN